VKWKWITEPFRRWYRCCCWCG